MKRNLNDMPQVFWGNEILWRLLVARGVIPEDCTTYPVDPEATLQMLEADLRKLDDLEWRMGGLEK